jgi:hypothetical protein
MRQHLAKLPSASQLGALPSLLHLSWPRERQEEEAWKRSAAVIAAALEEGGSPLRWDSECGGVTPGIRKTVHRLSRQGRPGPQDDIVRSSAQIGMSYKAAHISLAIK